MNLYIMTRGRVGAQRTWESIPYSWRDRTWLIVPHEEFHSHGDIPVLVAPNYVKNYSDKFKWIVEGGPDKEDKAVIIDDDLIFSMPYLKEEGKRALRTLKGPETEMLASLWSYMEFLLNDTALVGVHPRQMGHVQDPPYNENGKVICIQGINRSRIGSIPDLNKFPILADVVLNATLLERGISNKLITTFFQDWGSCQAPGGCSLTRTPEMQAEACYWLEERFGPYIKAIKKTGQDAWLGGERVDFRGQWKALYNAGAARLLDSGTGANTEEEGSGGTKTVD